MLAYKTHTEENKRNNYSYARIYKQGIIIRDLNTKNRIT